MAALNPPATRRTLPVVSCLMQSDGDSLLSSRPSLSLSLSPSPPSPFPRCPVIVFSLMSFLYSIWQCSVVSLAAAGPLPFQFSPSYALSQSFRAFPFPTLRAPSTALNRHPNLSPDAFPLKGSFEQMYPYLYLPCKFPSS